MTAESTKLDWSSIEPAIFGALFERSLDPDGASEAELKKRTLTNH